MARTWGEFGLRTAAGLDAAHVYRAALERDGWSTRPTYPPQNANPGEPEVRASSHEREGFKMMIISRTPLKEGWSIEASVHAWGPDGMGIEPGLVYPGFAALQALTRHCPECGKRDVDTTRVAFANRACYDCAPDLAKQLERPGWDR